MRVKSLSYATSFALSAALALSGCKSTPPPAAPAQTLNSDGTVSQSTTPPPPNTPATAPGAPAVAPAAPTAGPAPAATPAPAPTSAPVEQAPPPSADTAMRATLPPAPTRVTARSGTAVTVTITEQLSASKNSVGDRFTGVLAAPVRSSGGAVLFPRGARVLGTVIASKGRGRFKGAGALGIEVNSISGTAVSTTAYEKDQAGKGKRTAGFIGGGGGGGALIGGLAGGGKGALLGGLIGAGAGTAGAVFTGNKDVVIPSESTITVRLTAPVTVNAR